MQKENSYWAVVNSIQHLNYYLYGRMVLLLEQIIFPLNCFKSFKEPEDQLAHWIQTLCECDRDFSK